MKKREELGKFLLNYDVFLSYKKESLIKNNITINMYKFNSIQQIDTTLYIH